MHNECPTTLTAGSAHLIRNQYTAKKKSATKRMRWHIYLPPPVSIIVNTVLSDAFSLPCTDSVSLLCTHQHGVASQGAMMTTQTTAAYSDHFVQHVVMFLSFFLYFDRKLFEHGHLFADVIDETVVALKHHLLGRAMCPAR